jgi:bla regulator protein BlaR1
MLSFQPSPRTLLLSRFLTRWSPPPPHILHALLSGERAIANHLWQSTLMAVLIWLLTLSLRQRPARSRHALWCAASLKFLIPFELLLDLGQQLATSGTLPQHAPAAIPAPLVQFVRIVQPLATSSTAQPLARATSPHQLTALAYLAALLLLLWLSGVFVAAFKTLASTLRLHAVSRSASPVADPVLTLAFRHLQQATHTSHPTLLVNAPAQAALGIYGILYPRLLWPAAASACLTSTQRNAVLAHELAHVRHRDNLTGALHKLVEILFWFFPVVYWLGARLVCERERACDEAALAIGIERSAYAAGVLAIYRLYAQPSQTAALACTFAGSGNLNKLKERITHIMTQPLYLQRSTTLRALFLATLATTVTVPVALGWGGTPAKPSTPTGASNTSTVSPWKNSLTPSRSTDRMTFFRMDENNVHITNATPRYLIATAYNLKPDQVLGGPSWLETTRYDVVLTGPHAIAPTPAQTGIAVVEQRNAAIRALLAQRFGLTLTTQIKQVPGFVLTVAPGAPPLTPNAPAPGPDARIRQRVRIGKGEITIINGSLDTLSDALSDTLGAPVVNRTSSEGSYTLHLQWAQAHPDLLLLALKAQLGLTLHAQPVPFVTDTVASIHTPQ